MISRWSDQKTIRQKLAFLVAMFCMGLCYLIAVPIWVVTAWPLIAIAWVGEKASRLYWKEYEFFGLLFRSGRTAQEKAAAKLPRYQDLSDETKTPKYEDLSDETKIMCHTVAAKSASALAKLKEFQALHPPRAPEKP